MIPMAETKRRRIDGQNVDPKTIRKAIKLVIHFCMPNLDNELC